MTETLTIFTEFPGEPATPEERHQKRMRLEPLLFDILKEKYFSRFKANFQTYKAPSSPIFSICIFEARIHPNLEFLVYNAAAAAPHAKLILFCSTLNLPWLHSIFGEKKSEIEFRPILDGRADRKTGREEYNSLLKSSDLYNSLSEEHLLFLETDCYIRKPIPLEEWKSYGFCACPASWDMDNYVGGASYRRNSAMKFLSSTFKSEHWAHDLYTDEGVRAFQIPRPPFEQALEWFTESCIYEDPIIVHQWWTFFDMTGEDSEEIFKSLLTIQL